MTTASEDCRCGEDDCCGRHPQCAANDCCHEGICGVGDLRGRTCTFGKGHRGMCSWDAETAAQIARECEICRGDHRVQGCPRLGEAERLPSMVAPEGERVAVAERDAARELAEAKQRRIDEMLADHEAWRESHVALVRERDEALAKARYWKERAEAVGAEAGVLRVKLDAAVPPREEYGFICTKKFGLSYEIPRRFTPSKDAAGDWIVTDAEGTLPDVPAWSEQEADALAWFAEAVHQRDVLRLRVMVKEVGEMTVSAQDAASHAQKHATAAQLDRDAAEARARDLREALEFYAESDEDDGGKKARAALAADGAPDAAQRAAEAARGPARLAELETWSALAARVVIIARSWAECLWMVQRAESKEARDPWVRRMLGRQAAMLSAIIDGEDNGLLDMQAPPGTFDDAPAGEGNSPR